MTTEGISASCSDLTQPPTRVYDSWSHQLAAYHYASGKQASMMPLGMGWGKSKIAIDWAVNAEFKRILVLCPACVLGVWRREFSIHAPQFDRMYIMDKGTCAAKAGRMNTIINEGSSDPLIFVVNYESSWRKFLGDQLLAFKPDAVIADEIHRTKSPGGKASRFASRLGLVSGHRMGLTGTPMPHSPLDLYAQYRFLDRRVFGTSYAEFRSRYAVVNQMFPSKVTRWINQEELSEKFYSIAFKWEGGNPLDLPPISHHERQVVLPHKALRVYRDLETHYVASLKQGNVVAANALVKSIRLQQATSGFARLDEREEKYEEIHNEKVKMVNEILEDLPHREPVVVFVRFKPDIAAVRKLAERRGLRVGEVSGNCKNLTDHAKMPDDIDLLIIQVQSGSLGIDTTRASYVIVFSIGWSLGEYDQLIHRSWRPGQDRHVHFFHIVAAGTIDQRVYRGFEIRREVVDSVLNFEETA